MRDGVVLDYADTRLSNFVIEYLYESKKLIYLFTWGPGIRVL